jgi:PPM family protein phosphatase
MSATQNDKAQSSFVSMIDYAVLSHIGQRREENQDSFSVVIGEAAALFIVADGMGGASGGALASSIAARALASALTSGAQESHQSVLKKTLIEVNQEIFSRGRRNPSLEGMGTTISGLLLTPQTVLLCNVGDSRVYRVRDNSVAQLTIDHTLVGELLDSGALTPEQAEQSPVSHMLTRSIGPAAEVEVDCYYADDSPLCGDIYLICSDGLYNTISAAEIGYVIGEYRLHDALEHLVGLANMRGGADNISAILIECQRGFADTLNEQGNSSLGSGARKKIIEVSLAEAAASDTFSRVKKEFDISAEILWGAHANPGSTQKQQRSASPDRLATAQKKLTLIQRAIVVCAFVFIATLAWAFWVNQQRIVRDQSRPVKTSVDRRILDFNRENQLLEDAEQSKGVELREKNRRRELMARLVDDTGGIPEDERVARRKKRLIDSHAHLESQIASLDLAPDAELLEFKKKLEGNREYLRERLQTLEKEVERIGLSLNRWRQRLSDVDEIDTVNLTSELAQFSVDIKEQKEAFEQATWRYLKRLEDQRFDPTNADIQHDIAQLVKDRNQRLEGLAKAAREFIETTIGKDARERGLLLIERDEILQDEKNLLADVDYVAVRLSGDSERRKSLIEELNQKRILVEQELKQLEDVESTVQVTPEVVP